MSADQNAGGTGGGQPSSPSWSDPSRPSSDGAARRPIGVVVASAVDGFRTLLRQHGELARLEATEAASVRVQGVGMMVGAGVLAVFAVGFVAAAAAAALALVMPTWAANLIVAAVFAVATGALVLIGRRSMRTAPSGTEKTRETLKEDAKWARQQIAR